MDAALLAGNRDVLAQDEQEAFDRRLVLLPLWPTVAVVRAWPDGAREVVPTRRLAGIARNDRVRPKQEPLAL